MIESQCQDRGLVFECRLKGQMDDYYVGDDMKLNIPKIFEPFSQENEGASNKYGNRSIRHQQQE